MDDLFFGTGPPKSQAPWLLRPLSPSGRVAAGRGRGPRGAARQRHKVQAGAAAEHVRGATAGRACVAVECVCGAAAELLEQALQHVQRRFA